MSVGFYRAAVTDLSPGLQSISANLIGIARQLIVPEGQDDGVGAAFDSNTELSRCQHDLCRLMREYLITPSLRDGLLSLTYSRHLVPGRLRRLRRARQPGACATIFFGRDVGFAESGYSHESLRDNKSPGDSN